MIMVVMWRVYFLLLCWVVSSCEAIVFGGAGIAAAVGVSVTAIGAGYKWGTCLVKECCTDRWTRPASRDKNKALSFFKDRLFGQHLVMKIVPNAVHNHIFDKHPQKAL